MQIQKADAAELGLLITGLRAIYVADQEPKRLRLLEQLETELSNRYGMRIGGDDIRRLDLDMRRIYENGDNTHRWPK